jgi:hypothetical protein
MIFFTIIILYGSIFLKKLLQNLPNFQNFECKLTAFWKTGPVSAVGKPTGFRLLFNPWSAVSSL